MYTTKQQKPQQSRVIQSTSSNHTLQRVVLTRSMQKIVDETCFNNPNDVYGFYNIFTKKYAQNTVIEMINRILASYNILFNGNSFANIIGEVHSFNSGMEDEAFDCNEDFNIQEDEFGANISYHGDLNEYDDGSCVDKYIADLNAGTIQLARKGDTLSGPKSYKGFCGDYNNIAYMTGDRGDIDFKQPYYGNIYSETVLNDSQVDLPKTIDKKNRQQHFALADKQYAINKGWPKPSKATDFRKSKYTWHHLRTPHQMILVDMTVHAKHGHNGGVYLW